MLQAVYQSIMKLGLDFNAIKQAATDLVQPGSGFFKSFFSTILGLFTK